MRVEPVGAVDPHRVRANREEIRGRNASAAPVGTDPETIEIVAATKYVPSSLMGDLHEGGIRIAGENRLGDLTQKQEQWGDLFEWDFIGDLQSRKAPSLVGRVRLIHSIATESALKKLEAAGAGSQGVLVQVNLSGEESKGGITPDQLPLFIESPGCSVIGLMTMPPFTQDPEESGQWFSQLRELASQHGLEKLSMGTSQDYEVAVSEGANLVRIGASLCR